jgi:hypothetical protein
MKVNKHVLVWLVPFCLFVLGASLLACGGSAPPTGAPPSASRAPTAMPIPKEGAPPSASRAPTATSPVPTTIPPAAGLPPAGTAAPRPGAVPPAAPELPPAGTVAPRPDPFVEVRDIMTVLITLDFRNYAAAAAQASW